MDSTEVKDRLGRALQEVAQKDAHLFEKDGGERSIAARLAMYLQNAFPEFSVGAEYNRNGEAVKRLRLPDECAGYRNEDGQSLAVPDVIVHLRGPDGPNLLVLELKKTTNPDKGHCDMIRLRAFQTQLNYTYGALIICETRKGRTPSAIIADWVEAQPIAPGVAGSG